ncbi:streptomycin 6-kinase [Bacillus oleivorans]|uniref:Streptomycin 6-kinase n=1 Tax=Bacillus oleivorans TaxID=1448271 RepID=A0A285CUW6_9BACI|nr:aminoglycoside phosphotransferase family protein [Bacillus oleivorans]SNX70826.1 streptomycin 6-kinase [Bacillus oleivorans]
MQISGAFQEKIRNAFREDGKIWLESLEARVQTYLTKWQLTAIGPVENLSYNYVLRVIDSKGAPCILKMGVPNFDFQNEIHTILSYGGNGCAKLLNSDGENGAMLLEQLIPGTMLSEIKDEGLVLQHYLEVWQAIRRSKSANKETPSILNWFHGLNRYRTTYPNGDGPIINSDIDLAEHCFLDVVSSSSGAELLHGDLHHENILFSQEHGWVAIDPKGVLGDRYFDLISFLLNHLHTKESPKELLRFRVDTISGQLGLDRKRLLKAAIAMATLSACWSIEDQDPDWNKTYQCVKWFHEFLKENS